jgi:thioredoxin 1
MIFIQEPLDPEAFDNMLKNQSLVLVDFYATWCEPCKMLDGILADLEGMLNGKAEIWKLDVDQQPALSEKFGIRSVPTLLIFKKGDSVWRMAGFKLAHELREEIEKHY